MMSVVRVTTMVLYHGFIGLSIPNHIFFAFSGNLSGAAGFMCAIECSADCNAVRISSIFFLSVITTFSFIVID